MSKISFEKHPAILQNLYPSKNEYAHFLPMVIGDLVRHTRRRARVGEVEAPPVGRADLHQRRTVAPRPFPDPLRLSPQVYS